MAFLSCDCYCGTFKYFLVFYFIAVIVVLWKYQITTHVLEYLFGAGGCVIFIRACFICISKCFLGRRYILKEKTCEPAELLRSFFIVIPTIIQIAILEDKSQIYLTGIKRSLKERFNCAITIMLSGSLPERFGVPLIYDWVSITGKLEQNHALLTDQDFLIEPLGIIAGYSDSLNTLQIVQNEPNMEIGFCMLKANTCIARRFNIDEGPLSTKKIKNTVYKCLSRASVRDLPGVAEIVNVPWVDKIYTKPVRKHLKVHGPAIKLTITASNRDIFLGDFTFAIRCFQWPPQSDWPRRKKEWPSPETVATIKDLGFHFVPKSQRNDKTKTTWRHSFSLAERELSKVINEIARWCFLCLKIINKDHLKPICRMLTSYHMKSIFLHTLENNSVEIWVQQNMLGCLDLLLKQLEEVFHQQKCRHFWISSIDLFKDFSCQKLARLEERVKKIRKNPLAYVNTYSLGCVPYYVPCDKDRQLHCLCFGLVRDSIQLSVDVRKKRESVLENGIEEARQTCANSS